ncbi:hypothetical protein CPB84DRAFT_1760464 [Gymnopilus junonius]|uniref:Nucleoporin Pom152 n=1 Tax=Gymnopilus junonius TaxID=109634 RepID=A0A9P5NY28_GYMJU|nr:hypothetical protein CPB84DRAFT_1760464 [Gymnopilus junonius]
MAAPSPPSNKSTTEPFIPEKYLDVPSQRLYYLSLGLLCQSIKFLDFVGTFTSLENPATTCRKWLFFDLAYCVILSQLRIPRLNYSKATVLLQICFLWFLDGIMFGGIRINFHALLGGFMLSSGIPDMPLAYHGYGLRDLIAPLTFGIVTSSSTSRDAHLLGQHTVRMSPISTAHINPDDLNYCISPSLGFVLIPIVMNNTNIAGLKYSVAPLGYHEDVSSKTQVRELTSKDLKHIEQHYHDKYQAISQPNAPSTSDDEYDEYDDETESQALYSKLQQTQSLVHILLSRPGIVRLERVIDTSGSDARLVASETIVVPCPRVEFAEDEGSAREKVRCAGHEPSPQLKINVHGVPPLSLRWLRTINGNQEHLLVEGIEGEHRDGGNRQVISPSLLSQIPSPQDVTIPLTISLEQPGNYFYALDEITDGAGNSVRVGPDAPHPVSESKTTRSFMVLQKPAIAFSHCSIDSPLSLLKNSETSITIKTVRTDTLDAPWDVTLVHRPQGNDIEGNKRSKGWQKMLTIQANQKEVEFLATSQGDYTLVGVRGKSCTGTVLAPETCRVVEKPYPTAKFESESIHECSGDTGISTSIVLHGTPPFQVYYRMQRDKDPAREISKTFNSFRGELSLRPESSGHYTFTFTHVSDANYRKRELDERPIEKVIHPVASADFLDPHGASRGKKMMSTCSGESVQLLVALRGTPPWSLEIQTIGPNSTQTILFSNITDPKWTITVPIPEELRTASGSFEVDLLSVEDASKCKRPVSVPGVEVKVKRTVPTVRFYGKPEERRTTVTENERTSLPLRLTGDGPWRIKYKRASGAILTTTVHDQNSNLQVTEKGTYELLEVGDSQCPGIVTPGASTFTVDWIPRPLARLSLSTPATFETSNGSHILRPICEGVNDHVDLELTGRPPFQIMYNIAQNNEIGGTKIMGQPVFNSIQPHSRFQLQTSTPGRMYYEVKQIGDAAYPLSKSKDRAIPRSERLLFEQQVFIRPTARFRNRNRLNYCFNDPLAHLDPSSNDGMVVLEGTPPFILELSMKNIAASHVVAKTIQIPSNTWRLDIPSYSFTSTGPHLISIEKVTDASNCEQAALDPLFRSIWVDVAETAAIIPFERREDICVGDVTQFQLEGIPPWTIGYKINGKSYTQEAKMSPFSIVQHQSGEFIVSTIAHQQKMCKAAVADLRFRVHDLPSAQVGHGRKIFQDIHEGDQAEITFTLIGEPPFTFTYQRSELAPKKGSTGKVLETHTVSRVHTKEYSIFSALEGTWTVTSISDRYCRYPPAQPDLSGEKQI